MRSRRRTSGTSGVPDAAARDGARSRRLVSLGTAGGRCRPAHGIVGTRRRARRERCRPRGLRARTGRGCVGAVGGASTRRSGTATADPVVDDRGGVVRRPAADAARLDIRPRRLRAADRQLGGVRRAPLGARRRIPAAARALAPLLRRRAASAAPRGRRRVLPEQLDHIPWALERRDRFHAFNRLYHAQQELLQALFIAHRTYPVAYDKWIEQQLRDLLGLPQLAESLASMLDTEHIADGALTIESLLPGGE